MSAAVCYFLVYFSEALILLQTSVYKGYKQDKIEMRRWLCFTLISAVLNGLIGVLQKLFKQVVKIDQMTTCLMLAMLIGAIVPLIICSFLPSKVNYGVTQYKDTKNIF